MVRSGEIVGIAGISGNGQKELTEILAGQRPTETGSVLVNGGAYGATRLETRRNNVRFIPEEPLQNACAPRMTVSENLAFRTFDLKQDGKDAIWLSKGKMKKRATDLIADFKVKTASLCIADCRTLRRQCAAGGSGARADRRGRSSDRFQPVLRPRLLGRGGNPRSHHDERATPAQPCCCCLKTLTSCWRCRTASWSSRRASSSMKPQRERADISVIGAHMAGHH